MDESLKARLIGGAVLVALVVLLVPEILSGPRSSPAEPDLAAETRGTRTYTIDLGSGTSMPAAPEPVPAQPGREAKQEPEANQEPEAKAEPAPALVAKAEPQPEAPPESLAASRPAAVAATEPPPKAPAASVAKGGWAVQVGAFSSADAARKLVKELGGAGYRAYEAPIARSGKTLHRVRVGPEADRAEADRLAARLKARGLPATVVAND